MYVMCHLLSGIVLGILLSLTSGDKRLALACTLGAILPDLVDKPLGLLISGTVGYGRIYSHTLAMWLVLIGMGVAYWAFSRRTTRSPGLFIALGLGFLLHQALDAMWLQPATWFWPLLGPFPPGEEIPLIPYILADILQPAEWLAGTAFLFLLAGSWGCASRGENLGWVISSPWFFCILVDPLCSGRVFLPSHRLGFTGRQPGCRPRPPWGSNLYRLGEGQGHAGREKGSPLNRCYSGSGNHAGDSRIREMVEESALGCNGHPRERYLEVFTRMLLVTTQQSGKVFPWANPGSFMAIPEKRATHLKRASIILLFLSSLVVPAISINITARPETIANGYPITITVTDLPDGAQFSLLVEAKYSISPNTEFQFQMSQFKMPFSLKTSRITATLEGTSQNRLEVKKEDTIVTVSGKSTEGRFNTTKVYDIAPGVYDYFRLSGTTLPSAKSITTLFQVTGVKEGPTNSEIEFVVEGLPSGTISLAALVNGTQVLYKMIPVGPGNAPQSPAIGITSERSGSQEPVSFQSADGIVKISVPAGSHASIVSVPLQGAPGSMQVVAGPYAVVPYDAVYSPPGEIVFQLGEGKIGNNSKLAFFSNDTWTILSSAVSGVNVTASLERGGIYALIGPVGTSPTKRATTTTITTIPATNEPQTASPTNASGLPPLLVLVAVGLAWIAITAGPKK